jgi:hypothetical protein
VKYVTKTSWLLQTELKRQPDGDGVIAVIGKGNIFKCTGDTVHNTYARTRIITQKSFQTDTTATED